MTLTVVLTSGVVAAVVSGGFRLGEYLLARRDSKNNQEVERAHQQQLKGREEARNLKNHLEALESYFDDDRIAGPFETHSYRRDLVRPIESAVRLLPDADLREYVRLAVRLTGQLWVAASFGEGPERPDLEQARILRLAIEAVSTYVAAGEVTRPGHDELLGAEESLGEWWAELERLERS